MSAEDPRIVDRREFLWRFGGGLGGIEHTKLTFRHNGVARRLTAVPD